MMKLFHGGILYTPTPETERTCILVKDGVILDLLTASAAARRPDIEKADLSDGIAGPGLVDIHCHGALASDFADGIHVGPRLMEFVLKVKTGAKTALISDALRGVGCPPGDYAFGPRQGKMCRLIDTPPVGIVPDQPGSLASSAITLSQGLRVCTEQTFISLAEAWKMASATPAHILGLQARKGALLPGHDADILVLRKDLSVAAVYIKGEKVSC